MTNSGKFLVRAFEHSPIIIVVVVSARLIFIALFLLRPPSLHLYSYVTADPSILGTGMVVEIVVRVAGRLGAALKAGRLATTCSAAALEAVNVEPTEDGEGCIVRSVKTVGVTVAETLGVVTEAALALVEATRHE